MGKISLLRRYYLITAVFAGLIVIYVLFSLLPRPNPATLSRYHINVTQVRFLSLTIIIPYIIIWLFALVGYLRLRFYSDSINRGKDGQAFAEVSKGILILALWLPITAAISAISTYVYSKHAGATASLIIISNYINLLILLRAFLVLNRGAKKFASVTRAVKNAPNQWLILGFLAFASLYTWLSLSDPVRRHVGHNATQATYYEPDWLIILSIIIPRLIMWFLGLQAVQNIYYYRHKVKGVLYRSSLFSLAAGLGWVVIATIVLGSVQSLAAELAELSLDSLLLIIYLLLIIIGSGYYQIDKGAKKLLQIETS